MGGELLGQVGVGGIFAVLVIQMVLNFLKSRNDGKQEDPTKVKLKKLIEITQETCETVKAVARKTSELYNWHSIKDADGVPIWYYRRSMEDAIDRLQISIGKQTDVLVEISRRQDRQVEVMSRLVDTQTKLSEAQDKLLDKMNEMSIDLVSSRTPLPRVDSR